MIYATADDVAGGFRALTDEERSRCETLSEEAAAIIDATGTQAPTDVRRIVSCRMIRRALGTVQNVPYGATQGTITAGPYSQQWMYSTGSSGELYLGSTEKRMLGLGNRIGFTPSCLEG